MSSVRMFTRSEIEESRRPNAQQKPNQQDEELKLLVIHNQVYGISRDFLKWHPGGNVVLTYAGQDATAIFEALHANGTHETLANFYLGDMAANESLDNSNVFCNKVEKLRLKYEKAGLYDGSARFFLAKTLETLLIAALAWVILYMGRGNTTSVVGFAMLAGLFWQQSGFLTHDILHHQLSEDRRINNIIGYLLGNALQGTSVAWWKHKHSTHHAVPNVHNGDPDIDTLPFLAWSEMALDALTADDHLAGLSVGNQAVLFFPLLALIRVSWLIQSLVWVFSPRTRERYPSDYTFEALGLAFYWASNIAAAIFCAGPARGMVAFCLAQCVGGVLLALVVALNHNGMPVHSHSEHAALHLYEASVITGRNLTPDAFNTWFTGGLSYQIEHHLFPSIPRHNLHLVAQDIRQLCSRHDVPYHQTSLWTGLVEVIRRLSEIAGQAKSKSHMAKVPPACSQNSVGGKHVF